jgi:hypothetical protein
MDFGKASRCLDKLLITQGNNDRPGSALGIVPDLF